MKLHFFYAKYKSNTFLLNVDDNFFPTVHGLNFDMCIIFTRDQHTFTL